MHGDDLRDPRVFEAQQEGLDDRRKFTRVVVDDIGLETRNEVTEAPGRLRINGSTKWIRPCRAQNRIGARLGLRALRRAGENNDFVASGVEVVSKGPYLRFNSAHGGTEGVGDQNNAHGVILACLTGSAWVAIFG